MGWFVATAIALLLAWWLDRRRRVYADLETIPAAAVYAGRNEVKGRAWAPEPTISHETRTPCVTWVFTLEEERRKTRTNGEGKTETYTEWDTIEEHEHELPHFDLVDDTGSVRIVPDRAAVSMRQFMSDTFRVDDPRGFFEKLVDFRDNRTGRYRKTERGIAIGDDLFVSGEASLRDDVVEPQIDGGTPYVISTRSEDSHRSWTGFGTVLFVILAVVTAAAGGNRLAGATGLGLAVAGVAVLVLSGVLISLYNRLTHQVQSAARAWSLIDVQLARRHDLIPNLAAVARAATDHERVLLESLALARTSLAGTAPTDETITQADHEAAEQTDRIRQLLAVIEGYPDLETSDNLAQVQHEIADAENRIAGTREFYNDSVTLLRNQRQTFPGVLVARFADRRRFVLFQADGFERTVPPIEFDWSVGQES
ncbi:MAG: LemA family protein [Actinomycetota bacterium]